MITHSSTRHVLSRSMVSLSVLAIQLLYSTPASSARLTRHYLYPCANEGRTTTASATDRPRDISSAQADSVLRVASNAVLRHVMSATACLALARCFEGQVTSETPVPLGPNSAITGSLGGYSVGLTARHQPPTAKTPSAALGVLEIVETPWRHELIAEHGTDSNEIMRFAIPPGLRSFHEDRGYTIRAEWRRSMAATILLDSRAMARAALARDPAGADDTLIGLYTRVITSALVEVETLVRRRAMPQSLRDCRLPLTPCEFPDALQRYITLTQP